MSAQYDVLVVGGGPAGLGAAMALARLRRSVLVCDDGRPRNGPARHMHNFPGADGLPPGEWRSRAEADLRQYPTVGFDGRVHSVAGADGAFTAALAGRVVRARKVVLADGIQDRLPEIPGIGELWGNAVFHCPFCHGYENRGGRIGLIGSGAQAMHGLSMLWGLTTDLVLFTDGKSDLTPQQRATLERRGVPVVEEPVARIVHDDGGLRGVQVGGRLVERTGILVMPLHPYQVKSDLGDQLGCRKTPMGLYEVHEGTRTSVPGVFAAGDNMQGLQSVVAALAAGQMAGAMAAKDLLRDGFES